MAITKKAKHITVKLNGTYVLNAKHLVKTAELINIESTKQNLIVSSNKKVVSHGKH